MSQNAVNILKISITNTPKNEILEEIQKYLARGQKNNAKSIKIFTPNTEQLVLASKNPDFASVLNQADIAIPDTIGVVWASRVLTKKPISVQIPGVEFMEDLVRLAENQHVTIGLIGGYANLAVDALNCLRQKYPGLTGWAVDGPEMSGSRLPDDIYFSRLGREIVRKGTRIVFVALGPPKQEHFIMRLTREIPNGVIVMAVGGSFDIISGRLPRAPKFMRAAGFEWLWRLILEPRRIVRQVALFEFILLVLREKLRS